MPICWSRHKTQTQIDSGEIPWQHQWPVETLQRGEKTRPEKTAGHSGMVWTAWCDNFENFSSYVGLSENGVFPPNIPQWNSHLAGIMISKTIGCRGTLFSDKPIFQIMLFSREKAEKVENPLELWGNYRLGTSIYSYFIHRYFDIVGFHPKKWDDSISLTSKCGNNMRQLQGGPFSL